VVRAPSDPIKRDHRQKNGDEYKPRDQQ